MEATLYMSTLHGKMQQKPKNWTLTWVQLLVLWMHFLYWEISEIPCASYFDESSVFEAYTDLEHDQDLDLLKAALSAPQPNALPAQANSGTYKISIKWPLHRASADGHIMDWRPQTSGRASSLWIHGLLFSVDWGLSRTLVHYKVYKTRQKSCGSMSTLFFASIYSFWS